MDKNEAKLILGSLRPGGQDDEDPQAKEALLVAAADPDLSAWLAKERELDSLIAGKLNDVPVPEGLRDTILAGGASNMVRPRFQVHEMLAWAAVLVLLITLGVTQLRQKDQSEFASYHVDMVDMLNGVKKLDMQSQNVGEIKTWLTSGQGPGEFDMPGRLEQLSGLGCKVINWNGEKVALICFKDPSNVIHDTVHLIVMHKSALSIAPPEDAPVFASLNNVVTASWSAGEHSYILAGHGQENFLGKYF
ncbi:DUF3379 domain-containing protein [Verrucomicrobia bacterium]|nr:DUF3379 domain-containing protein [Verrucomicrobiota bacterium]